MVERVTYIDATNLKDLIDGGQDWKEKAIIIDVRDEEFAKGHILGATNIPVDTFQDDDEVDKVIEHHLKSKDLAIVHCQLSQQRGPFAAKRLASRLQAAGVDQLQVQVLQGGFERWSQIYGDDPKLTNTETKG
eukprot:jgi/Botrbrau1/21616/Bobra.43_1s0020.1